MDTKTPMKTIIIWEQAFQIPANLSAEEEDEAIARIAKPAAEEYLRKHLEELSRREHETRGRKRKPLSPVEEEAERLRRERLDAPMELHFVPTTFWQKYYKKPKK